MGDRPIVSDGTSFASSEWYDARWQAIPTETRAKIVRHLQEQLPESMLAEVRELHAAAAGDDRWIAPFHFSSGMQIRTSLREVLTDDQLPPAPYPDGEHANWDDYYVQALEAAAGVRDA